MKGIRVEISNSPQVRNIRIKIYVIHYHINIFLFSIRISVLNSIFAAFGLCPICDKCCTRLFPIIGQTLSCEGTVKPKRGVEISSQGGLTGGLYPSSLQLSPAQVSAREPGRHAAPEQKRCRMGRVLSPASF